MDGLPEIEHVPAHSFEVSVDATASAHVGDQVHESPPIDHTHQAPPGAGDMYHESHEIALETQVPPSHMDALPSAAAAIEHQAPPPGEATLDGHTSALGAVPSGGGEHGWQMPPLDGGAAHVGAGMDLGTPAVLLYAQMPPGEAHVEFVGLSSSTASLPVHLGVDSRAVREFGVGLVRGLEDSASPFGIGGMLPTPMDGSNAFQIGRGLAQLGTGIVEFRAGASGEAAGVLMDATGVGAVEGVPLNIVSGALIAQGAGTAAVGLGNLAHGVAGILQESGAHATVGSGSGSDAPPGTSSASAGPENPTSNMHEQGAGRAAGGTEAEARNSSSEQHASSAGETEGRHAEATIQHTENGGSLYDPSPRETVHNPADARAENHDALLQANQGNHVVQDPHLAPEYRSQLDQARQVDGLSASKNPDRLVMDHDRQNPRVWDTKHLGGDTADVHTAMLNVQQSIDGGQAARFTINIDGTTQNPHEFASALRSHVHHESAQYIAHAEANGLAPTPWWQGVREVWVTKGGEMVRAWP